MQSARALLPQPQGTASRRQSLRAVLGRVAVAAGFSDIERRSLAEAPTLLEAMSKRQHQVFLHLSVRVLIVVAVPLNVCTAVFSQSFVKWMLDDDDWLFDACLHILLGFVCLISLALGLWVHFSCSRCGAGDGALSKALCPEACLVHGLLLLWMVASALYALDAIKTPREENKPDTVGTLQIEDLLVFRSIWFRVAFILEYTMQLVWLVMAEALRSAKFPWPLGVMYAGLWGLSLLMLFPDWPPLFAFRRAEPPWGQMCMIGCMSKPLLFIAWSIHKATCAEIFSSCLPGWQPRADVPSLPGRARRRLLLYHLLTRKTFALVLNLPIGYPVGPLGSSVSLARGLFAVLVAALLRPADKPSASEAEAGEVDDGTFSSSFERESSNSFDIARAMRLLDFACEAYASGDHVDTEAQTPAWRKFTRHLHDAETDTHCLVVEESGPLEAEYKMCGSMSHDAGLTQAPLEDGGSAGYTPVGSSGGRLGSDPQPESVLVIAFRGTASWRNIVTDLQVWPPVGLPQRAEDVLGESVLASRAPLPSSISMRSEIVVSSFPAAATASAADTAGVRAVPHARGSDSSLWLNNRWNSRTRPRPSWNLRGVALHASEMFRNMSQSSHENLFDNLLSNTSGDAFNAAALRRRLSFELGGETIASIPSLFPASAALPSDSSVDAGSGTSWLGRCRQFAGAVADRICGFLLWCMCLWVPTRETEASFVEPEALMEFDFSNTRVHRGFHSSYLSVRDDLLTTVGQRLVRASLEQRSLRIYLTGHSLGGALATLCALDFSVALRESMRWDTQEIAVLAARSAGTLSLYTFGAPRPGNSAFRTLFNVLIPKESFRIVDRQDVITESPPERLGFRQVGREVWLDEAGEPTFVMSWSMHQLLPRRRILRHHPLSEYFKLLSAKYRRERGQPYLSPHFAH